MRTTFRVYDHLARLPSERCAGLTEGFVYVFPKLDGVNARITLKDGKVLAGSRRRDLTEIDPLGFGGWCKEREERLVALLSSLLRELAPTTAGDISLIVYGEFLVPQSTLAYQDEALSRFWIFDVHLSYGDGRADRYSDYSLWNHIVSSFGFDVIPPISQAVNPTAEHIKNDVKNNRFLMKKGHIGEGVVIKRYNWANRRGNQIWAKVLHGSEDTLKEF